MNGSNIPPHFVDIFINLAFKCILDSLSKRILILLVSNLFSLSNKTISLAEFSILFKYINPLMLTVFDSCCPIIGAIINNINTENAIYEFKVIHVKIIKIKLAIPNNEYKKLFNLLHSKFFFIISKNLFFLSKPKL